jgi:hypothetical protein
MASEIQLWEAAQKGSVEFNKVYDPNNKNGADAANAFNYYRGISKDALTSKPNSGKPSGWTNTVSGAANGYASLGDIKGSNYQDKEFLGLSSITKGVTDLAASFASGGGIAVSYTHLRAHETG